MKRFGPNDIFVNTMRTHPQSEFFIYNGNVYYDNEEARKEGVDYFYPKGHTTLQGLLYESGSAGSFQRISYKKEILKGGALSSFKSTTANSYNSLDYGDTVSKDMPYSSSITPLFFPVDSSDKRLKAIKNSQLKYSVLSRKFTSSYENTELMMIEIPSIFYGSCLKKGSLDLKFFVTGSLVGRLQDTNKNGELIETTGSLTGSVGGLVLYDEGIILLTGSWSMDDNTSVDYVGEGADNPKWKYFGTTSSISDSSFRLNFQGKREINVLTMFSHAGRGEFNHSNNPTYTIFSDTGSYATTGSNQFKENPNVLIKNVATSSNSSYTGSFSKETYISSIKMYDEDGHLLAVVKLGSPIRKREKDSITFKTTLDI